MSDIVIKHPGQIIAAVTAFCRRKMFGHSAKDLTKAWVLELHFIDRDFAEQVLYQIEGIHREVLGVTYVECVYVSARSDYYLLVKFDSYQQGKLFLDYLTDLD